MAEHILHFHPSRPQSKVAAFGQFLRQHRGLIIAMQWLVVVFYAALVVIPAFMPIPPDDAHIWDFRVTKVWGESGQILISDIGEVAA